MNLKEKNKWLDELLDEEKIISFDNNLSYCVFIESLIKNSTYDATWQSQQLKRLEIGIKGSELEKIVIDLKDNQIIRDCRDQFKKMCEQGVFNK